MIDWLQALCKQHRRFWSKVDRNGPTARPDLGCCWLYKGRLDADGYGVFMVTSPLLPAKPRQKAMRAHRASWLLADARLESVDVIMHLCDVRACVNPKHLTVGTQLENVRDMVSKRRHPRNETHGRRLGNSEPQRGERNGGGGKLTSSDVIEILSQRRSGIARRDLAQLFGVSETTIKAICSGTTWSHVTGLPPRRRRKYISLSAVPFPMVGP